MTVSEKVRPNDDEADERIRKRMAFSRTLAREGYADVLTLGRESGRAILGSGRLEIVDRLQDEPPVESVRALADDLDRDKAGVSRDLKLLAERDVVEYEDRGRAKVPRLKHETVVIEPVVYPGGGE